MPRANPLTATTMIRLHHRHRADAVGCPTAVDSSEVQVGGWFTAVQDANHVEEKHRAKNKVKQAFSLG